MFPYSIYKQNEIQKSFDFFFSFFFFNFYFTDKNCNFKDIVLGAVEVVSLQFHLPLTEISLKFYVFSVKLVNII